jgi:hypothetical protein
MIIDPILLSERAPPGMQLGERSSGIQQLFYLGGRR